MMSRSGYNEDIDQWALIRWRGQVASAIRGKRGQAFIRELIDALDAISDKRLIAHDLQAGNDVCAIGSVGRQRGVDMTRLDPEAPDLIANVFGIAEQLVREIAFENDDAWWGGEAPEHRWQRMHAWATSKVTPAPAERAR